MNDDLLNAQMKAIRLLETLAHVMQDLLSVAGRGAVRNRAVVQLAGIDQKIAEHKERIGILGQDDFTYLND